MGTCHDKTQDLANTIKVLSGSMPEITDGKSWLHHADGAANLDKLFARGATHRELTNVRHTWEMHRSHLRSEHGLEVVLLGDKWRLTGKPHDAQSKSTITDKQYRAGYEQGRDLFVGKITKPEALAKLVGRDINKTSGAFMLEVTRGLLSGQVFKRALKDEAYGWYLSWVFQDYGLNGLQTALKSAWLHLAYREEDGAIKNRIRLILEQFENIVNGQPVSPEEGVPSDTDTAQGKRAEKKKVLQTLRYGQPAFRKKLLVAYKGQCAVTGCRVERALAAAHVRPYCDDGESKVSNGLLLRVDIHALFDAHLLGIDPETYTVKLSPSLLGEKIYWQYEGAEISKPDNEAFWPDRKELAIHLALIS